VKTVAPVEKKEVKKVDEADKKNEIKPQVKDAKSNEVKQVKK
jgi:hypothetical protein